MYMFDEHISSNTFTFHRAIHPLMPLSFALAIIPGGYALLHNPISEMGNSVARFIKLKHVVDILTGLALYEKKYEQSSIDLSFCSTFETFYSYILF